MFNSTQLRSWSSFCTATEFFEQLNRLLRASKKDTILFTAFHPKQFAIVDKMAFHRIRPTTQLELQ